MIYSFHDKGLIEHYLRGNTLLHLYELGDLDDFFWQHTNWYGLLEDGRISQLGLLYTQQQSSILIALTDEIEGMRELLRSLQFILPRAFHAHLSEGLIALFTDSYKISTSGLHYKMALTEPERLAMIDTNGVEQLSSAHQAEIETLYTQSYPDNSFDARMLETGYFYGLREEGTLVSIAGIHAYSPLYRVAAIGNVTTRPDRRGHGLGTRVCAKLCQQLRRTCDAIGLNVKADNVAAIASYRKLGFSQHANYAEYDLRSFS